MNETRYTHILPHHVLYISIQFQKWIKNDFRIDL